MCLMEKNNFLLSLYKRIGPIFVKGKGSWLWDKNGNKYLDLFPGWGVGILGHCHPRIVKTISGQAKKLIHLPNNLYHQWQDVLAKEIIRNCFNGKVFFANSGAEAVEAAIKFSRLYGRRRRFEIITMRNSFHGRTFGALSCTGQDKYKLPFRPLLPLAKEARFNDFNDFKKKVTKKTVGLIIELIQGEGGVCLPDPGYLRQVFKICRKNRVLLIMDEIQAGLGRTGSFLASCQEVDSYDILCLGKGLAGGIPVGATLVSSEIAASIPLSLHTSTFGGNPLAAAGILAVLNLLDESRMAHVRRIGDYFLGQLKLFKSSFIQEVRGRGVMLGVEINDTISRPRP